ncbi:MAG: PEP/pyruvate-binding domain-containing protein [bacterium]
MTSLLQSLKDRARELDCLYEVDELLRNPDTPLDEVCLRLVQIVASGMRHPDLYQLKIRIGGRTYCSPGFAETERAMSVPIDFGVTTMGSLDLYYSQRACSDKNRPFLEEEAQLLTTIGRRLGSYAEHQTVLRNVQESESGASAREQRIVKWRKILRVTKLIDPELHLNIARKMLYRLSASGIAEAGAFFQPPGVASSNAGIGLREEWNVPHRPRKTYLVKDVEQVAFRIAVEHLGDEMIQSLIEKWLREDKLSHLERLITSHCSVMEMASAVRDCYPPQSGNQDSPSAVEKSVLVSLIRRVLSDQLNYIDTAKRFMRVGDIGQLLERVACCTHSTGSLGGKSAGMHLAAQILRASAKDSELLDNVKIPRTWHVASDAMMHFVRFNGFDDVIEQKYKEPHEVRSEYPYIVQTFKSARFPPGMINGLTFALDYFGECPLIVRSSSLLEDRAGASLSGKYRSLFLANQGDRHERLDALTDAIAEVYASTFCPDAIEYRSKHGLLDYPEEMGIMIQEVVGSRVGDYFLPTYGGVACGRNEFSQSPDDRYEDTVVRLVPGLGTHSVDQMEDDRPPVVIVPGQPGLRLNACEDRIVRRSPKKMDVINLATDEIETLNIDDFLSTVGATLPSVASVISVLSDDHTILAVQSGDDLVGRRVVVTFDQLICKTKFIQRMQTILETLEREIGSPVEVKFASDGRSLYLLQCRPLNSFR